MTEWNEETRATLEQFSEAFGSGPRDEVAAALKRIKRLEARPSYYATTDHDARWAETAMAGMDAASEATLAGLTLVWLEFAVGDPRAKALEKLIHVIRYQVVDARAVFEMIVARGVEP